MSSGRTEVVREFYRAVAEKDAPALEVLIGTRFDEAASVVFPESLPYGGTIGGAARLAKVFTRMAASPVPVGATDLVLTDLVDSGDQIAAHVEFAWYPPGSSSPVPSSALELWTFTGDRVQEIRAFYWDTAALVAGGATTSS